MKLKLEKKNINETFFGDHCMKSEDFGAPAQKAPPKYHSCDQTQQKENLILEPERITFRKFF